MSEQTIKWESPILIGGAPSSGTTLLSVILDAHSEVLCGPEIALFASGYFWANEGPAWQERLKNYVQLGTLAKNLPEWNLEGGFCPYTGLINPKNVPWYGWEREELIKLIDLSSSPEAFIQHFYGPILKARNKRIWAEKTPSNIFGFRSFLARFPQGRVIYMVRDARDTACSLMRRGFSYKRAVSIWLVNTAAAIEAVRDHPRAFAIRYEDFVSDPRTTINNLLDFLELPPEAERMLAYTDHSDRVNNDSSITSIEGWTTTPKEPISQKSVGQWRGVLTPEQLQALANAAIVEPVPTYPELLGKTAAQLLAELGYDAVEAPPVNTGAFANYLIDEDFLVSGHDYWSARVFQERYVMCQAEQVDSDFNWDTATLKNRLDHVFRGLANIQHIQQRCDALETAAAEAETERRRLEHKLKQQHEQIEMLKRQRLGPRLRKWLKLP